MRSSCPERSAHVRRTATYSTVLRVGNAAELPVEILARLCTSSSHVPPWRRRLAEPCPRSLRKDTVQGDPVGLPAVLCCRHTRHQSVEISALSLSFALGCGQGYPSKGTVSLSYGKGMLHSILRSNARSCATLQRSIGVDLRAELIAALVLYCTTSVCGGAQSLRRRQIRRTALRLLESSKSKLHCRFTQNGSSSLLFAAAASGALPLGSLYGALRRRHFYSSGLSPVQSSSINVTPLPAHAAPSASLRTHALTPCPRVNG